MEMLLTGQPIPASDALDAGLVNRVVSADDLEEATLALAGKVASAAMSTIAIGKPAFYRQMAMDRPQAYELAQRVMVESIFRRRTRKRELGRWSGETRAALAELSFGEV